MKNKTIQLLLVSAFVILSGTQQANASLLQLSHEPLFLNQAVDPALAVTFDDSGSMAWGYMGRYYGYDTRQFADPTLNKVYYNPNIVYRPPIGADGVELPQSNFFNAKIDGFDFRTGAPKVDLSQNFIPIAYYYFYSQGDYQLRFARIPNTPGVDTVRTWNYNDNYPNATNRNATGRAAFYYLGNTRVDVPASQRDNFANWYTYYSNRLKMGKTAVSRAFATFGPNFKISWQQLNRNTTFPALEKFELNHRKNFFKWLFSVPSNGGTPLRNAFHRAGRLFQNGGSNDSSSSYWSVDYGREITCQQNFHIALSDGEWNGGFSQTINQDETSRTKLPGDSKNLYGAYSGNGEQKIYPKSESGTTLSDIAFHYWSRDLTTLKNNVKRYKSDYTNTSGNEIVFSGPEVEDEWLNSDFAWNPKNDPAYWQHMVTYNVGMGLEASRVVNYVQAQIVNNDSDPNNNITQICPDVTGLTEPKEIVYRGLRTGACTWPGATNGANKIDDVWHSSINSRGDFFSANDPQELTNALNKVVDDILQRLSKGSTSSISSGIVTSSTKAYTPGFDSSNWTGNLFSRPVNADGSFGDVEWDLSCKLTGGFCEATQSHVNKQANRRVFTINTNNGNRVRFIDSVGGNVLNRFNESSEELRTRLNVSTEDLINYLLGDQTNEVQNNGVLRNRKSVLADVVHSSPAVQRGPSGTYVDSKWPLNSPEYLAQPYDSNDGIGSYEQYKIDNQNRRNMVYIGSNTGMLHAVNINNGSERWAYIPSKALENISRLADNKFKHWSYVDNTPVIGDAFFNSQWNTVLISGMRYGGQAFFALDVTDTDATRPTVMWEFTDEDDADMGFSYGKATIAKIASIEKWVALIPNGYNNSQKDYPSLPDTDPKNRLGDGSAVLYVVDISNGDLIAKLDTNVGTPGTPNGMAPAVAVVSNYVSLDSEVGADMAYAGDLYGNLWRFDLTSADPDDWARSSSIHKVVEAQGIKEQPITVQPRVIPFKNINPTQERDTMVFFATGKYIETPDRSLNLPADQFVVGLVDGLTRTDTIRISQNVLKEQSMITNSLGTLRNFGPKVQVNYGLSDTRGWKLKLPEPGERVANPIAKFGEEFLLVTTTLPAGDDPCDPGGISWLLAMDPMTGHQPDFGDLFQRATDENGNPLTSIETGSGIRINDLIIGSPPIVENLGGGNSNIIVEGETSTTVINLKKFTWRRRGWANLLTD